MKSFQFFLIGCLLSLFQAIMHSQIPGAIDPTFGNGGNVEIKDPRNDCSKVNAILMSDGKIIIASSLFSSNSGNAKLVLTRLLSNGSLDNTFGSNGQVFPELSIDLGKLGGVSKIIATNDNRFILLGYTSTGTKGVAFVIRLDANGSIDESFGNGGILSFDFGLSWNKFLSALIKPDGRILLGGFSSGTSGIGRNSSLLVQLLPDGNLDPDFATNGVYLSNPEFGLKSIYSLVLQEDEKIVTFGASQYDTDIDIEILRFNSNGTLDSSFANEGRLQISGDPGKLDFSYAGIVQPNQKIVFCGVSYCYDYPEDEVTLHRINPDGSLDSTFGTDGTVFTDFGMLDRSSTIASQADGKILVATDAYSINPYAFNFWLARYNSDGSLDLTFGNDGKVKSPNYNGSMQIGNILLDNDEKIIYTSIAEGKVVLWRYLNSNSAVPQAPSTFRFQFKPNPVADQGLISWTIMQNPEVLRVDLFDAWGQLIKQLIPPTFYPIGSYQQAVNFEKNTPAGVYYLAFTAGNDRQILKVVKF